MNINTSNYWSASSASSKGFSGLVSGMDTESMVQQMLGNTQKKIDAQKGLKTQTLWKQTMYRDIISSINTFRNKYFNTSFDASSNMNFASSAFFNTMKASLTSGSGVKIISTDSSALTGDMKIKVNQLASAAKVETQADHKISSNTVTGNQLDSKKLEDAFKKELKINVKQDGVNKPIEITVDLEGAKTEKDIINKVNEQLKANSIDGITAESDGGRLLFKVGKDSKNKIDSLEPSALAAKMTGLAGVKRESNANGEELVGGTKAMDPTAAISFDVTLDGVTKNIKLDNVTSGKASAQDISKAINEKLKYAFGENVFNVTEKNGAIQFEFGSAMNKGPGGTLEEGHSFRLTGVDLNAIGITPGATSNISMSTKLGDLSGVSGGLYEFTINGKSFSFDHNTTVGQMMNEINTSGAGVKISYSAMSDKFVMESSSTGAKFNIEMSQSTGNLLGAMFGKDVIQSGSKATSDRLIVDHIQGDKVDSTKKIKDAKIAFVVNGEQYQFELPAKDKANESYTVTEFETKFNEFLTEKFGKDNIRYDAKSGKLNIKEGYEVSVTSESVNVVNGDKTETLNIGLAKKDNFATDSTKIDDVLNLTAEEKAALKNGGKNTLGDFKNDTDIQFKDGRFTVNQTGATKLNTLMKGATFGTGALETSKVHAGTDAKVVINGVETSRSSNTFTVDGITMELTGVHKAGEEAVIGTSRDIDVIVDGFEAMVKDYNEMLDKLYGYTDAKAEYRDYPPLTDAQKKEMSDREIELWEEKAKTGLLRRDSNVDYFLSQMRLAMYERPNGCKFALYDIGVETGTYTSKGKLTLDKAKLRQALADDPAAVEQLFMDASEGLSKKLDNIMKDAANPSSGSPGTLVSLAGAEGYGTEKNNSLTQQMKEIEQKIKDLENKYEKEKNRYWKQFNTMEQILANFNNQSAMIQSQFMSF